MFPPSTISFHTSTPPTPPLPLHSSQPTLSLLHPSTTSPLQLHRSHISSAPSSLTSILLPTTLTPHTTLPPHLRTLSLSTPILTALTLHTTTPTTTTAHTLFQSPCLLRCFAVCFVLVLCRCTCRKIEFPKSRPNWFLLCLAAYFFLNCKKWNFSYAFGENIKKIENTKGTISSHIFVKMIFSTPAAYLRLGPSNCMIFCTQTPQKRHPLLLLNTNPPLVVKGETKIPDSPVLCYFSLRCVFGIQFCTICLFLFRWLQHLYDLSLWENTTISR